MKTKIVSLVLALTFFAICQTAQACYWYMEKTSPFSTLLLSVGQSFQVPYQVTVMTSYLPIGDNSTHLESCTSNIYDSFQGGESVTIGSMTQYDVNKPRTFSYTQNVKFDVCGEYQLNNTAFTRSVAGLSVSDNFTINVSVPCSSGCSLTHGYWKTHSSYGPAPYDSTWALRGEDTPFFLSGKTWYEVLWTAPAKGNPYYTLAHQYIAAHMNKLSGADTTEIESVMVTAAQLFNQYTPTGASAAKSSFINAAYALDQYNNGITGPGHCSE